MVNSITYIDTNLTNIEMEPSDQAKWKAVSEKILQVIDFKEFNKKETPSREKITIYSHVECLHFSSFFSLLFNELTKVSQLETENDRFPELYYEFVSETADFAFDPLYQPDDLDEHLKKIVEPLSNQDSISSNLNHPFWSALKDCLINSSFDLNPLHRLFHCENPQEKIPIQVGHLFSCLKNIFNHLNLITPILERKYRSSFPSAFFNGKEGATPLKETFVKGLGALHSVKTFQLKFHQLIYKTNLENVSRTRINEMIDQTITIIKRLNNDLKNITGIFTIYPPQTINKLRNFHTLYENVLPPEAKLSENLIIPGELISVINQLINPLVINNFTVQDIKTLIDYYESFNNSRKVIFKTVAQPLFDMLCISKHLKDMQLSDEVFHELILQEDIPFIHFPTQTNTVTENFDRLKLHSPYIGPKKTPKISTSHFTKPSPEKKASTSAVPVPIPLNIPLTKRFPPLVQMQEVHASLQHAALYLDDIDALESFPPSFFKCVITCNSVYRLWEQKFRNEIYTTQSIDIKEHHLMHLGKKIDQAKLAPVKTLIEKLSGAHMWTEQMFESYYKWKHSYRSIPPVLQEIYTLFQQPDRTDCDFEQLVEESTQLADYFFESPAYPAQENAPLTLEGFKKTKAIKTPLASLLKKINPNTPIGYKLLETQKDLELLNQLEGILKSGITSSQLPLLVRMTAKLHHGILQHLLQAIYLANNYEEKREHDLLTLVESIHWKKKLPQELLEQLGATYEDLHRLSNYPFDATTIQSDWHRAILESIIIRADPSLINGFHYQGDVIKMGTIEVNPKTLSLEKITNQLKNSKELLLKTLPLLFEELTQRIVC